VIATRWSDAATGLGWVDLRVDAETQSARIAALPEVAASPEMAWALRLLNAPQDLLMTTKCDRWRLSDAERVELADALDEPQAACGVGSYIDVLTVHAVPRSDFLLHEEWVRTVARHCAALPVDHARVELVVRPAHDDAVWGAVSGYGVTVYCYAGGAEEQLAEAAWGQALEQTIPVLIVAAEAMFASVDEIAKQEKGGE
jgi:hypothetical protein